MAGRKDFVSSTYNIFAAVLAGIGLASAAALVVPLVAGFTFLEILKGVNSIALRQQVTPDHLLGRVTAAFWTINSAPGPIGAALFTLLAARAGAPLSLSLIGVAYTTIALFGLRTPARARRPEDPSLDAHSLLTANHPEPEA